MRGTPRRPPDGEWEGTWLGEGVGMDHGKGAGTTEPAPVGPAGDAGPIKPGGTKTVLRPYCPVLWTWEALLGGWFLVCITIVQGTPPS